MILHAASRCQVVGAVSFEITRFGLKDRCSASELRPCYWSPAKESNLALGRSKRLMGVRPAGENSATRRVIGQRYLAAECGLVGRENFEISRFALRGRCSASELPACCLAPSSGVEPDTQPSQGQDRVRRQGCGRPPENRTRTLPLMRGLHCHYARGQLFGPTTWYRTTLFEASTRR